MSTLWIYPTPRVAVKRGTPDEMDNIDPEEQAKLLCVLLFTAMPSGVVRQFLEMTGSDPELVFDIGNRAEPRSNKIPKEVKELVKKHKGSARQTALVYGISKSSVNLIRKNGG